MDFVVHCIDKPGSGALRRDVRADHLEFVLHNPGRYRYGGPLLDPQGLAEGSLMVMSFDSRAELDAYLAQDPYVIAGLFQSVTIWPTRQIVPELSPGMLQKEIDKQRQG